MISKELKLLADKKESVIEANLADALGACIAAYRDNLSNTEDLQSRLYWSNQIDEMERDWVFHVKRSIQLKQEGN